MRPAENAVPVPRDSRTESPELRRSSGLGIVRAKKQTTVIRSRITVNIHIYVCTNASSGGTDEQRSAQNHVPCGVRKILYVHIRIYIYIYIRIVSLPRTDSLPRFILPPNPRPRSRWSLELDGADTRMPAVRFAYYERCDVLILYACTRNRRDDNITVCTSCAYMVAFAGFRVLALATSALKNQHRFVRLNKIHKSHFRFLLELNLLQ